MSTIDKQRIAAVKKLDQLGYAFAAGETSGNRTFVARIVSAN